MSQHILIVEDDVAFAAMLSAFLERNERTVKTVHNGMDAKKVLADSAFEVVITDLKLPDTTGIELLEYCKETAPGTRVLIMTGYADVTSAVDAIKKGAIDYISKPFRPEELLMVLEQSENVPEVASSAVPSTNAKVTHTKTIDLPFVKGISEVSKKFNEYVQLVGPTNMCVLIQGESGTGKEVAAKAIHDSSMRHDKPFIAVDCGAIPKEIAASEFFGHVKGSFTGAVNDKIGHFQAADGGTLFLDEVGNLSYENQIQLLRALQERRIKPVGSNAEIEVDLRIISATNEDLTKAVNEGTFREDLYHRLNEFSVHIPSLHERKDDLFLFTEFFLNQANIALGKQIKGFDKMVETAFKKYSWPGNLRELKNVIKRAVLLATGNTITLDVIPREVLAESEKPAKKDFSKDTNEKLLIINALKEADNNKAKAARLLNITRKTLYNKLKHYEIQL
ncbi:MAG TPA: sigma-54-dependent Fis family transcriptional regulator [Flavobacteriaceae bacterium]|jgi:two-component system response regulator HydG|nr:sigma-54-dependent Fis family transcriptional regulator [Flavobacteriaceae bacterium]MAY53616.1 sigma-54-dependent Fis family transcriptional regulator [Flavobacteriaceae bacterium]HBR52868.1 sigma-54-dependent Fis family transcriptional regulator [Flavobacteriaceae bacterium]HIB46950.1 sigma-54-dependent Fis family transcriptional regulator [Flavobacteriaceae bacterium]HIN99957.1 sigma-54-dependent Fis family transcriptional regulator [Flavobacteriaceae bacterium]|tara:strand:+ start:141627 stop:142976 length:1350 start_codon:yes stop_codon:yes gene_type:complete